MVDFQDLMMIAAAGEDSAGDEALGVKAGDKSFNAIGFTYGSSNGFQAAETADGEAPNQKLPSTPFSPPFNIPEGMETPLTMQMHKVNLPAC